MNHTKYDSRFPTGVIIRMGRVMGEARYLSGFSGDVILTPGDDVRDLHTNAHTTWPLSKFLRVPRITVFARAFEGDDDALGITLTHEMIHCRQGALRVFCEKLLWWLMFWRVDFPPIETEAYDAVNLWHDAKLREGAGR